VCPEKENFYSINPNLNEFTYMICPVFEFGAVICPFKVKGI
jgi:hypothetical protein